MSETAATAGETDGSDAERFEVVVVGGGPAGLTAALYTTRLGHATALLDRGGGRAAMMRDTHNVVGVPESVSGNEFLATAREQVESYGAATRRTLVTGVERTAEREGERATDAADPAPAGGPFRVETQDGPLRADAVVLATGFTDVRPDPPLPRTGRGLHYCLHCDAYMFVDQPVYVMGHGESAAQVAMIMLNFTPDVDLLLRGEEPAWSEATDRQLAAHPVEVIEAEVAGVHNGPDGWLERIEFADGAEREYRGGFPMYGSEYNTDLAEGLGCDLNDDGTVAVDDHGRTSVDGVFAVGDVTPGHKQIPVAMGEGAKAGIAAHYALREFPRSLDAIEERGAVTDGEVPGIDPALRAVAREHPGAAGEE